MLHGSPAGTASYVLEQGKQYMTTDLPGTTSIQPSAADCANKCKQHHGKKSNCTAWTWHHPTAASLAGKCQLFADRPDTAVQVKRNSQATSGSIIGEPTLVQLRDIDAPMPSVSQQPAGSLPPTTVQALVHMGVMSCVLICKTCPCLD